MRRVASLLLLCAAFATGARAQAPCCSVTAINATTGIVTAKVNVNGAAFQFKVTNANLLKELRIGAGVYANFTTHQISLDGKSPSGTILTLLPVARKPDGSASIPIASGSLLGSVNSGTSASSGNTNVPQASPLCSNSGGTSNPLTADDFSKSATTATLCFVASCGASTSISGTVFPAGMSDWLTFYVPAPRANCATPVITVSISPGTVFDVQVLAGGPAVVNSLSGSNSPATAVPVIAGLGTAASPLQPGMYFIRVYGGTAPVGTWTLKIKS
jgi:hypothetical protein